METNTTKNINDQIKILLVEDHELTRVGIKSIINEFPKVQVICETASGKEAVNIIKSNEIDLVLMDITLLDMDGVETTSQIKQINPNLKVLILSNSDEESIILDSFKKGADGYMIKDSNAKQMFNAIMSVYNGDTYISSSLTSKVINKTNTFKKLENPDFTKISSRELDVLKLIVAGKSNADISKDLFISLATTKTHVRNILNKLNVVDRTQAAVKAMREGIVD